MRIQYTLIAALMLEAGVRYLMEQLEQNPPAVMEVEDPPDDFR